jgi:hypothetical protein
VTSSTAALEARALAVRELALSDRTRAALLHVAHSAAQVARELAAIGGEDERGFRDAEAQLMEVCDSLVEGRASAFHPGDEAHRYALHCVVAWTTKQAAPPVRLELRRFGRLVGVTR